MSDDVGFVLDDPLNDFPLLKLHRLGHGRGKIDVILVWALLTGDELNFGWISHGVFELKFAYVLVYILDLRQALNTVSDKESALIY